VEGTKSEVSGPTTSLKRIIRRPSLLPYLQLGLLDDDDDDDDDDSEDDDDDEPELLDISSNHNNEMVRIWVDDPNRYLPAEWMLGNEAH